MLKHLKSAACAVGQRSLDAGGRRSSAATPNSADTRGSSRSRTGHDDEGDCADGGPNGLLLGVAFVYVYNQRTELTKAPEVGLLAGVMPTTPINQVGMLTGYVDPGREVHRRPERESLTRSDTSLSKGARGHSSARLWQPLLDSALYDARTDQVSELGQQYGTKPGFYMVVGPNWKGRPRPA